MFTPESNRARDTLQEGIAGAARKGQNRREQGPPRFTVADSPAAADVMNG